MKDFSGIISSALIVLVIHGAFVAAIYLLLWTDVFSNTERALSYNSESVPSVVVLQASTEQETERQVATPVMLNETESEKKREDGDTSESAPADADSPSIKALPSPVAQKPVATRKPSQPPVALGGRIGYQGETADIIYAVDNMDEVKDLDRLRTQLEGIFVLLDEKEHAFLLRGTLQEPHSLLPMDSWPPVEPLASRGMRLNPELEPVKKALRIIQKTNRIKVSRFMLIPSANFDARIYKSQKAALQTGQQTGDIKPLMTRGNFLNHERLGKDEIEYQITGIVFSDGSELPIEKASR